MADIQQIARAFATNFAIVYHAKIHVHVGYILVYEYYRYRNVFQVIVVGCVSSARDNYQRVHTSGIKPQHALSFFVYVVKTFACGYCISGAVKFMFQFRRYLSVKKVAKLGNKQSHSLCSVCDKPSGIFVHAVSEFLHRRIYPFPVAVFHCTAIHIFRYGSQ